MKLDKEKRVVTLEKRECFSCNGEGKKKELKRCPRCERNQHGKACQHCGSKSKYSHRFLDTGQMIECSSCKGTGQVDEGTCDYIPNELLVEIYNITPIIIYRQPGRALSWSEEHMGLGCLYSCVDYGRSHKLPDGALLDDVKSHSVQLTKIAKDGVSLCDHIGVFVGAEGYSVRACWRKDGLDAKVKIANEGSRADVMENYRRLCKTIGQ